jgi:hypothetical protein
MPKRKVTQMELLRLPANSINLKKLHGDLGWQGRNKYTCAKDCTSSL